LHVRGRWAGSFTPPGQAVLDTTSIGGWYQGFDGVRVQLIELGLPNRKPLAAAVAATPAPAVPAPTGLQPVPVTAQSAAWPRVAASVAGFLILAAAAAVSLRRRLGHGPATTR
jgi:hypothetical protein